MTMLDSPISIGQLIEATIRVNTPRPLLVHLLATGVN